MKQNSFSWLLLMLALIVFAPQAQAQSITDCEITYDIDIDSEEMDAMAKAMMAGSKLKLAFKDDKARVEMKMAMMSTTAIMDDGTKEGVVLMNMLGQKLAMRVEEEEFEGNNDPIENYEVKHTGKTKKIAGYMCKQAKIVDADGNEMDIWYTDKIKPANSSNGYSYSQLEGFPLEMDIMKDNMKMKMVAKTVSTEKMDASMFSTETPPGYQEMTQEQMQMMGGGR